MPARPCRFIIGLALLAFVAHVFFDIQLIIKDRAYFLDNVTVTVKFLPDQSERNVQLWRETIDNRVAEFNDVISDSIRHTNTYRSVPRVAFVKKVYVSINDHPFDSITVNIGSKTFRYAQWELLKRWTKTQLETGQVAYVLPIGSHATESAIPAIDSVINWKGDSALIWHIVGRNSNILLFIGLFIVAYSCRRRMAKVISAHGHRGFWIAFAICFCLL